MKVKFLAIFIIFLFSFFSTGNTLTKACGKYRDLLKNFKWGENAKVTGNTIVKKSSPFGSEMFFSKKDFVSMFSAKSAGDGDLIVGYSNADEVLTVSEDTFVNGDIYIINNGVLNIQGSRLKVKGNIFVLNNGKFLASNSTIAFLSKYVYSNGILVSNSGSIEFENVVFDSSGFVIGMAFVNSSQWLVNGCVFSGGVTVGLYGNSVINADNVSNVEWVIEDGASLSIENCHSGYNLVWTTYGDGSNGVVSFPSGDYVNDFSLPYNGVNGVDFSLNISDCSGVLWGLMVKSGANLTVSDSSLRGVAVRCDNGGEWNLNGVVNNSHFDNRVFTFDRLYLEFNNVDVVSFNIYQDGGSKVNISNSVFGEFGAMNGEDFSIFNSIIDGTGGYLFVNSDLTGEMINSLLNSHVVTSDNSIMVFFNSSIQFGDIVANDQSVILLVDSMHQKEPVCYNASLIVDGMLNLKLNGSVNSIVPIRGTAIEYRGEENQVEFGGYRLFYRVKGTDNWIALSDKRELMVKQGVLAIWNTEGLDAGNYELMLKMFIGGEEIDVPGFAFLIDGNSTVFPISHIDNGDYWSSYLVLDNVGEFSKKAKLTIEEGGRFVEEDLSINPYERKVVALSGECGYVHCDPGLIPSEFFVSKTEGGVAQFNLLNSVGDRLDFLFPLYLKSINWKGLAIQNTTSKENNVEFKGFSENGEEVARVEIKLKPDERKAFLLTNLFSQCQFEEIARVEANSTGPVSGISISGEDNHSLLYTNAVSNCCSDKVLIPHIANEFDTWENLLVIDNGEPEEKSVYLTLFSKSLKVVDRFEIKVGPYSQKLIDINQNFSGMNPDCGFVEKSRRVFVRQSFVSGSGGFAEFLLSGDSGNTAVFNLPAGDFLNLTWYGIAISNISDIKASIVLKLYSNHGEISVKNIELSPHTRVANTLKGFFGDIDLSAVNRVVTYSNTPVTGIVIAGNGLDNLLFLPCVFSEQ